ncbi:TPA: hypothetical protein N0F65_003511 [Lagenidium giganteum]|uniref:Uncharacterized protein n=1 Tax=Lagenidium giganteum TaxID=4803 RepID=A0AAV2YHJ0_9STRA|nr:TPA: hypothetical protein N0F65_003511 [Lagenidium giganteum]
MSSGASSGGSSGSVLVQTGVSTGGSGGSITLSVGSGSVGSGGSILLSSGGSSAATGGFISIASGVASTKSSGSISLSTATSGSSGVSGNVDIYSGTSGAGTSGTITLSSGSATGGSGGAVTIGVGSGDTGVGGALGVTAGATTAAANGGQLSLLSGSGGNAGGNVLIQGGAGTSKTGGSLYLSSGTGTATSSGSIFLATARSTTGGSSGGITLSTGAATTGKGGDVVISVGSGNSGAGGDFTVVSGYSSAAAGGMASLTGGGGVTGGKGVISGGAGSSSSGGNVEVSSGGSTSATSGNIIISSSTTSASATGFVKMGSGASTSGTSGSLTLSSGSAVGGKGGDVVMSVGSGDSSSGGGAMTLTSGASTAGTGGTLTLSGGSGSTTGAKIQITGGAGGTAAGGEVNLQGGASTSSVGGAVTLQTGSGASGSSSGDVSITSGVSTNANTGAITIASGASTGGKGGAVSVGVGSATVGNGGALTITSGTTTASSGVGGVIGLTGGSGPSGGGSINLQSGDSSSASAGSVNMVLGTGVSVGSFNVKTAANVNLLSVTSNTVTASSAAISLSASTSSISLTAATTVSITGTGTTVSGGILHVDSHDFRVSSDGSTDMFRVTSSTGAVTLAGSMVFSANAATLTHSGSTSLTMSSPMLILTGGSVIFDGSASTVTVASACTKGTFNYDSTYIYLCTATNTWMRVALTAHYRGHCAPFSAVSIRAVHTQTQEAMHSLPSVLSAIHALYGMFPSAVTVRRISLSLHGVQEGAERQRQANEYLLALAQSEVAWVMLLQVLSDPALPLEGHFFAANMLHTKARKDWLRVASAEQASIATAIRGLLDDLQHQRRTYHAQLFTKLCSTFAIAMISSPTECRGLLEGLLQQGAVTRDPAFLVFFLTFSRCICEEISEAEVAFSARDAMEALLHEMSPQVITILSQLVIESPSNGAIASLSNEILACLKIWVKRAGISLTRLSQQQPELLETLTSSLGSRCNHVTVCAEILTDLIKVAEYPTPAEQEAALTGFAHALAKTRPALESAIVAEEDELCHAITTVVSTFAETFVDWIVDGENPETLQMAELLLYMAAQPRRQIALLAVEFWLLVQEEPVASRPPFLQHDAFIQLFEVVLRQSAFPRDASSMDELDVDDLMGYRDNVKDVLLAIFALLKDKFLNHVASLIKGPRANARGELNEVEVALFALSSVAEDLRKRLAEASTACFGAVVSDVFEVVLVANSDDVLVIATASKLFGQFGTWLCTHAQSTGSDEMVVAVLHYLIRAMGVPSCLSNACKSFMQVLVACSSSIERVTPDFLVTSLAHFENVSGGEDRLLVVEGLVRVASQSVHCSAILHALLNDSVMRLDYALARVAGGSGDEFVSSLLQEELLVLGKVVRFLDAPAARAGGKNVTRQAVDFVWLHVAPVSDLCAEREAVMEALFQFYGWCLQSLGVEMADRFPDVANLIVRAFEQHRYVSALECGSVAVDVFGKSASNAVIESFRGLMGVLSRISFQFFTTHALDDAPEVLRALFAMAYRFLLFCPTAVLTANEFPVLVDLSLACVGNQERNSTNAVLMFLTYLVNEKDAKLSAFAPQIDAVAIHNGYSAKWVATVLDALSAKSPSVLLDGVGKLFFAYLSTFRSDTILQATLYNAMAAPTAGVLTEVDSVDRELVLDCWMRFARTHTRQAERRFRSLATDFARVCRKEQTGDVLQAYEEN